MTNTTRAKHRKFGPLAAGLALGTGLAVAAGHAAQSTAEPQAMTHAEPASETLSAEQRGIPLIAASMAASGACHRLNAALHQGLDAGLTVSEAKEILVQLYAYVGFPRSLNALSEPDESGGGAQAARRTGCARARAQPGDSHRRRTAGCRHGQPDTHLRRAGQRPVVRLRTGLIVDSFSAAAFMSILPS